jgi:SAM-dependent methyltransferase
MWSSVAPGWEAHAAFIDERGATMTRRMLELTRPCRGEHVLELACGPGGLGLAVAPLVTPATVVLSDVAPEMTAIAAARASELGVENVTTRTLDLERLDEPDNSFDVVVCREGLMLVPEPARAAREIRRVLRPGGRAALTVWGPRAQNPWLAVVFDTVSEHIGEPVPPPGVPHPFSLDDAGELESVLIGAGLSEVRVTALDVPYRAATADEWWERTVTLAGPLAQRLRGLPDDAAHVLRTRAHAAVSMYETATGLELPGVALLATGTRA